MASKPRIHTILADMLAAYDNGEADDQRSEFIAGWAATIVPPDAAPAEPQYVLVHGSPFDQGLSVEGPYPKGVLDAQDLQDGGFHRYGGWWVVHLDEPTVKPSE